jgi:hypothetical protein
LIASLRVQTFLTTFLYVTADAAAVYSGTFDSWEGDGFAVAKPMAMRSPLVRLYLGFDI